MISVAEAIEKIKSGFDLLTEEQVSLDNAHGRVLANNLTSRLSHPPVEVSAMDGYAVRARDVEKVPVKLKQIGMSQAGAGFSGTVGAGETARIFTGAPLPNGADSIVIQENTEAQDGVIKVLESVSSGKFVRAKGLDFNEGDVLLKAGRVLSARDLGLAAAMNYPWVSVRRRPKIAIVATGDEVVMPGETMTSSQIISSNSIAVAGYVRALGGDALSLGIAKDTPEHLKQVLAGAKGADMLITIGGASVGDFDFVRDVAGDQLTFYKIAMRPGKPLIFGQVNSVPLLGLPGNPVSAGVTSFLFLKTAFDVMLGCGDGQRPVESALAGIDIPANNVRQDYIRATLFIDDLGNRVATPFQGQDSSMLARFAHADCMIKRPPHAEAVEQGGKLEIIVFPEGLIRF